jgi:hypothetical protein
MPQTRMTIKIGSFTGSLTNESNIITNVDNTEQLGSISFSVGDIVKGPSIPANTRISEIGTGSITLTNDATNTIANAIFVVLSDNIQVKDATTLNGMTFDEISESAVAAGADGEIQFNDNSSLGASSNLYWDNTNKRLGIGTTSPITQLHATGKGAFGNSITTNNTDRALNLVSTDAVMKILRVGGPTAAPAVELISRTTADGSNVSYWDFYTQPSDVSFRIRDRTNGDKDRLTIASNGNIGIGTTTPIEKLDVNGNIKADIFKGNLQGTADKIKTIRDEATNSSFFPTFVDSNNETATSEELYTNSKLYYNPFTSTLYLQELNISGDLTVGGSVSQVEIENAYTSNDHIFLREGAVSGLGVNQYAGLIAQNADGTNDSGLVFNGNGIARIGDISYDSETGAVIYDDTQAIATREDSPTDTSFQFWNDIESRLNSSETY